MKTALLISASLVGLNMLAGCGFTRTPEVYRDDTRAVLEKRNEDIHACYDGVLKASPEPQSTVTVKFDVLVDTGQIANVVVDKPRRTRRRPTRVGDCVTKSITGLTLAPADANKGEGTWVYQFAAPAAPRLRSSSERGKNREGRRGGALLVSSLSL